jgi:hypothetical protein
MQEAVEEVGEWGIATLYLAGTCFYWTVMGLFHKKTEVAVAQHSECAKCHQRVHFKIIDFVM